MIIRLTVEDNDFGNVMKNFLSNLDGRMTALPSNIRELGIDTQLEILNNINKINKLLNPNVTEKHTEEEKTFLKEKIIESFAKYVLTCKDEDTANYLIKNFSVDIIDSMEDKWENGEAWYWFQHSRVVLNQ